MGDGTKENPYTREDVLRLIEENGGTAKELDLSGKTFEEGIDLSKLDLEEIILKEAELWGAHLEEASLSYAHLEGAVLWGAHLEKAYLLDAHLKKAVLVGAHLEGADLSYAYLERADLMDAKISSDTRLAYAGWGNYILGEEEIEGDFYSAEDTYRMLKMWYTEHGMYDIAAKFFFREMTAKRKQMAWSPNPFPRLWSKFLSLICGYGEEPYRVIAWAALAILVGALIYFAIGTLQPNTFLDCLYYSATSFTALGYGGWVKDVTGWVKALGAIEAFVGVFMIALFLVTFVRKMTR